MNLEKIDKIKSKKETKWALFIHYLLKFFKNFTRGPI